ncbi:ATP-dependent RNA helicase DHX33-like [Babylonia areolata]|uniref:ATP-dependent RNA helicase DHX33-like n=1 Tax=Babylonia areolata TaxID=304850 RepID=UPI003FD1A072
MLSLSTFRKNLPVFQVKHHLLTEVTKVPTAIIMGETGSGKTTQIPQYLLERGMSGARQIAVTQPRRVAAISLAQRVSKEMGVELGKEVGYCVRFEDVSSPRTRIRFMTDGMLLRETLLDPLLKRYSVVILDEAHERTVQTDILFGVVKGAQAKRAAGSHPLKVIVMSATMDVDHFSSYFNNAPVLYVEGRHFPVQVLHSAQPQSDYLFASLVTLFEIHKSEDSVGDVLIFLTGQDEIESAVRMIREVVRNPDHGLSKMVVLPLYAALPSHLQLRVFEPAPPGCRKVVVSTNIAETSVTISGIKYVIDCGRVKAKIHNPSSGLDLLRVVQTSKEQCVQRTGRAGREGPGVCFRLFTQREFEMLKDNTVPEIQRCNLASVVLQLLGLNITRVMNFDFIDPPSEEAIVGAVEELHQLAAVQGVEDWQVLKSKRHVLKETDIKLTAMGRKMLAYPLEPRLSKALLLASEHGCLEEVLSIVSVLSVDTVFVNPANKKEEANSAREKFTSSEGDHITLLNIFRAYKASGESKQFCEHHYLNRRNLSTAMNVRKQLRETCARQELEFNSCGRVTTGIRKCLAAAFFMNAAELQKEGEYLTVATRERVCIHPSSVLARCKPAVLIYTELVKTTKCYMRDVSVVDPAWLMDVATSYFKRKRLADT